MHADSLGNVLSPSSRGPAYDGRIKPELVAFAEDGSSGAAAIVSGISLVLQQAYKELNGNFPSAALVRAILLNSADDVGPKGIDFVSGFGAVNAYKALLDVTNAHFFSGSISNGTDDSFDLKRIRLSHAINAQNETAGLLEICEVGNPCNRM